MLASILSALVFCGAVHGLDAQTHRELLLQGRPQVGLWKALTKAEQDNAYTSDSAQVAFSSPQYPEYKAYCFDQKVSHFEKGINGTFCQRYWADARYYVKGGPVIVVDGGETSGEDRLPFLKQGILEILANATGGLSIVLEHRYYGKSVPVKSFSTDDLRFLNNAEALQDSANFIEHFQPPASLLNVSKGALHPSKTPWIYYGGSYAGARAAHMIKDYPHLVWGAIASSAVTHAQVVFPEYFDPIQEYGDEQCISTLQEAVKAIDLVLDLPGPAARIMKGMFGLEELADDDFAEVLQSPIGYWQAQNWDPAVSTTGWTDFCSALTSGHAGSTIGLVKIPASVVNYARYIKENVVSRCPTDVVDCFGSYNDEQYLAHDLQQTWRLWLFQVCTQWGYFMPAPEAGLPSILSRKITLEYSSKICRQAFPRGEHFVVPEVPNVDEVNSRGSYGIEAHRLAFIDGDRDPWRPMTPQSDRAPWRNSTVDKPMHIIYDAIHHYDENGLSDHSKEPARIRDVHAFEVNFVQEWLAQWEEKRLEE